MSVLENVKNAVDHMWFKTNATAGFCSNNIETMYGYLDKGEKYSLRASQLANFVVDKPEVANQLKKGADAIGKIKKPVSLAKNACSNLRTAQEISDAIYVLNQWVKTPPGVDNAAAAKAFDKLFGGAAKLAENIPGPAKEYARILEQISISGFFSNMQKIMDPESKFTPRGRALKSVMEDLYAQGRP